MSIQRILILIVTYYICTPVQVVLGFQIMRESLLSTQIRHPFLATFHNHILQCRIHYRLHMAAGGRGMSNKSNMINNKIGDKVGMGIPTKSKKKTSEKTATPFNVNASLSRLEKKYDELTKAHTKKIRKKDDNDDKDGHDNIENSSSNDEIDTATDDDDDDDDDDDNDDTTIVTTEYVVAVRADGHIDDWVPIAQLCLARSSIQASNSDGVADPSIQAAISYYCRELSHVASLGSRIFQSVPRNLIQYSVETLDSFHKHVYETTIQGKNEDTTNMNTMTKQEARIELELMNGDGEDKGAIKRAYRTLSFTYHPDRFVNTDRTTEEIEVAHEKYLRIQLAYDTLNSGIRTTNTEGKKSSWYQSLGGKARTDFIGPVSLLSIDTGKSILETSNVESAITCMSPSIVQCFVARSSQQ
jgi:DnaJ domain